MNIKNILLFIGGVGIGGVTGVFGSMKYFQNKYQRQYEEDHAALEKYYHRTDEYARTPHDEEEDFENDGVNPPNEEDPRPGGRMSQEERKEVKAKLNRNWEGTTNYAKMYQIKNVDHSESELSNDQNILAQDESEEENPEDDESTPEEEAFDEHQKNKHRDPRIISEDAYSGLPSHVEARVLYFYAYDETLVDGDNEDEPIDEPEKIIGDALVKYGFIDNDERIIFVMNYDQDVCYEIQKVDASWSDSH